MLQGLRLGCCPHGSQPYGPSTSKYCNAQATRQSSRPGQRSHTHGYYCHQSASMNGIVKSPHGSPCCHVGCRSSLTSACSSHAAMETSITPVRHIRYPACHQSASLGHRSGLSRQQVHPVSQASSRGATRCSAAQQDVDTGAGDAKGDGGSQVDLETAKLQRLLSKIEERGIEDVGALGVQLSAVLYDQCCRHIALHSSILRWQLRKQSRGCFVLLVLMVTLHCMPSDVQHADMDQPHVCWDRQCSALASFLSHALSRSHVISSHA